MIFVFLCIDWNSALFIILNGTKEEHLDMLDGGIIQRLLEEKWKTFARVKSLLEFLNRNDIFSKTCSNQSNVIFRINSLRDCSFFSFIYYSYRYPSI